MFAEIWEQHNSKCDTYTEVSEYQLLYVLGVVSVQKSDQ